MKDDVDTTAIVLSWELVLACVVVVLVCICNMYANIRVVALFDSGLTLNYYVKNPKPKSNFMAMLLKF